MSKVWYQGILKATVSGLFEDLKLKISEGSDKLLAVSAELRQPPGQSQDNFIFGPSFLKS